MTEKTQVTWFLKNPLSSGEQEGTAEITLPDGSIVKMDLTARPDLVHMNPPGKRRLMCIFDINTLSATQASGLARCNFDEHLGKTSLNALNWTATRGDDLQKKSTTTSAKKIVQFPTPIDPVDKAKQADRSDDDQNPWRNPGFLQMPVGQQEEIKNETTLYSQDCRQKGAYAKFHDCECLTLHYANERIKSPTFNTSQIQSVIQLDCVNPASIKVYSFDQCRKSYSNASKAMCNCYSQKFADEYSKAPNPTNVGRNNIEELALAACRSQ